MKFEYELKIIAPNNTIAEEIYNLIGIRKAVVDEYIWSYIITEEEKDSPVEFINVFTNIIHKNKNQLKTIGVEKENITIWLYYEYDVQCNIELRPDELKKLSEAEVPFCISCWQK